MSAAVSKAEDHSKEYSEVLSNLTIVVPTYRRPVHVQHTINFWRGRGPKLLILDGSPTPFEDEGLFDSVEGLTYVHLPKSIQFRLSHCPQYVQTDYVTLMGDDEVLMPSSLAASMQELDHNPELASCLGWSVGFKCDVSKGLVTRIEGLPGYLGLHFLDNNQESAQERLLAHFGGYVPSNVYSVVRANAFRNAIKMINAPGERVYGIGELEFEIAILYQGGNRVLPNLHWLRNHGDSGDFRKDDPDTNPLNYFHTRFLDPEYSSWRENFLSTRSEILSNIDGRDVTQVRIWLEDALQLYSEICAGKHTSNLTTKERSVRFMRKNLRAAIPAKHRGKVRNLLNLIPRSDPTLSLQDMAEELSSLGMNYSEEELQQVITERLQY